ncbi:SusC/RagA family TonB-linked outer membrane protein [Parapedobacter sp. ISTM3]|uniref:SusC/RagA family TonB-linked outer membrane protein n=1 Tax=Parapedobacter sp. ISTM3 TaxID=2800130 RepID=UPI001F3A5FAA|nr:SusC/RagA family TonB-linked outer membrane protein [Parapedobacter sp. ISTM3]
MESNRQYLTKRALMYGAFLSLCWGPVTAQQYAHASHAPVQHTRVSLEQALKAVASRINKKLVYDTRQLAGKQAHTVSAGLPADRLLEEILTNTGLTYRVEGDLLVIFPGDVTDGASSNRSIRQQLTVRGHVKSADGEPLVGVSVSIKGTTTTVSTGISGQYSITAPEDATLVFALIGFVKQEQAVAGRTQVDVLLEEDNQALSEVVVTALGIKREEKALGYGVSVVKGEDLTDAISNNWSDALKGKVAGLNLTQTGSGPLNSTRINLRGDRSLDINGNEALVVIDGIPMINGKISSGVDQAYGAGASGVDKDIPIDFGNGLSDINPDDIESVTVLKGAAASALYGSRAANGALIITTKSGRRREGGIGITVNSNTSIQDVLRWPDWQYEYGQGNNNRNANGDLYYSYHLSEDGANTGSTSSAFGPRFDGQYYFQYDPEIEGQSVDRRLWRPYTDNIKGFWRTGLNFTNSVALDGATDRFSARASLTHTKNEWIMPNTGFERIVASLNSSAHLSKNLQVNAKMSYTAKSSDNLPGTGYNNQSIGYFMIFQNPNVDLEWYRPIWKQGKEQLEQIHPFSSYIENPYLIAYEMTNGLKSNTVEGNLQGIYTFDDRWSLMVRSGLNMRQDKRDNRRPYNTANFPQGYYKEQDVYFFESNTDMLLTYQNKLTPAIDLRASLGANAMRYESKTNNAIARGLLLPGIYKLSNALEQALADNDLQRRRTNSVYGFVNFSYRDLVFLDITGRNDWSSTLPDGNNSYFYPSVSSSYILSDIFSLPDAFTFAKARLSWAMVGNDTYPYRTAKYYSKTDFPGSAEAPSVLHNADLKPEISRSWEAGVNVALFNNRINTDVNVYTITTENQVLSVPLDITTGYSSAFINAGEIRNRGIEVMLSGSPVKNDNFSWTATATWSTNNNRILSLSEDVEGEEQIIATSGTATLLATVGGSIGDIWGFGLVRNPEGQVVFNGETGLALPPNDISKIGNAYADWRAGLVNEFQYKNWRFSATIDGQYGGLLYSQSHHKMTEQGKLRHTLLGRETMTVIGEGVVLNDDGSYSPNTTPVPIQTWYGDYYRRANIETNSFDASYLKLREVRLEYNLPVSVVSRWRLAGASIAVYGRDLAMISDFPIFDPETASLNGATIVPGVEMGQLPTPRTWGVNLRFQF